MHAATADQWNGCVNGKVDVMLEEHTKHVQVVCFINVNSIAIDAWLCFHATKNCFYNGKEVDEWKLQRDKQEQGLGMMCCELWNKNKIFSCL